MGKLKSYIFTFGSNQQHEGKYVKINAKNMSAAREKMFKEYGDKWAFCYEYEEYFKAVDKLPSWYPRETILAEITVTEGE